MDVISRKEVLEYLDKRRTYELMDGRNKAYGKGIRDAIKDIEALPSVQAVPLDKLCEWLENNASMYYGTNVSRHAWKQMITSDLMEENTNDAE